MAWHLAPSIAISAASSPSHVTFRCCLQFSERIQAFYAYQSLQTLFSLQLRYSVSPYCLMPKSPSSCNCDVTSPRKLPLIAYDSLGAFVMFSAPSPSIHCVTLTLGWSAFPLNRRHHEGRDLSHSLLTPWFLTHHLTSGNAQIILE